MIKAPFTPEQVEALNAWQQLGYVHEFTCGWEHTPSLVAEDKGRVLVADADGWACPTCSYTQDWAHDYMADKAQHPPHPAKAMLRYQLKTAEIEAARKLIIEQEIAKRVAVVEKDEAKIGVFSTGEQLAVALVLDRQDLFPHGGYTILEAVERLGPDWFKAALAVQRARPPPSLERKVRK